LLSSADKDRFPGMPFDPGWCFLKNLLLRVLGTEVALSSNVWVNVVGYDCVSIGSLAAVSGRCHLTSVHFYGKRMLVGHVEIGTGCSIGLQAVVQSGSRLLPGACVEPLSVVPENALIAGEWSGVPARPSKQADPKRVPQADQGCKVATVAFIMSVQSLLLWLFQRAVHATFIIKLFLYVQDDIVHLLGAIALLEVTFIALRLFSVVVFCRCMPSPSLPVDVPLHSCQGRIALAKMQLATECAFLLGDASMQMNFLRACGAKVGSGCHLSEAMVLPDTLEIGENCFFASGNVLTSLTVDQGRVKIPTKTVIGDDVFLGNFNIIHAGLRSGSFAGRFTWLPHVPGKEESRSFFGNPAMPFLRSKSANYVPTKPVWSEVLWQQFSTSIIDVFVWRALSSLQLPCWYILCEQLIPDHSLPLMLAGWFCLFLLVKWTTWWTMYVKVGNCLFHEDLPLSNDVFSAVVTSWYRETQIRKAFGGTLELDVAGTAWQPALLRLTGARVGKRFFCPNKGAGIVDRPFARLGDDITLDYDAFVHQHTFEDCVLKWRPQVVGSRTTLRQGACLACCDAGSDVVLLAGSVTWKGQELESQCHYEGCPAKASDAPSHPFGPA